MNALLTAVLLAQTISVGVGSGGGSKSSDSTEAKRRENAEVRRQVLDSVRRKVRDDSSEIRARRARIIPLTPALMASAFKDPRAGSMLEMARKSRLEQDSSLTAYDASTYERMSVGIGFKRFARERLLMRMERAARVVWSRNNPIQVQILGKREAFPALNGILDREDSEIDETNDGVPIPYYPGREGIWVGSGLAKADIEASEIIHPLARGAEAYYTYASGDSVSFQLPGGRRIEIRELIVRPRVPKWNVALGSLWFDASNARLVRAVFRLAEPMDIWAIADEEAERENDPDDAPPKWVKGMVSPLKAQVNAVTIEYGLHEGRYWMPRVQAFDGSAQAGMFKIPFKMEQTFKYASVNGTVPVDIEPIAYADTAQDSVSRAFRRQRARTACSNGGVDHRTTRTREGGRAIIVRTPCDTAALARSSALPESIYDEGYEAFSDKERDELIDKALSLGAQAAWVPQKPIFSYGLSQTRYNKIEALSTGIGVRQVLGQGYTARASLRLGIGDWQPNGEIGMWRSNGRSSYGLNAYRRLSAADDFANPFSLGSSLSALLFGRDDGFYYRRLGIEFSGTPDDSASTAFRLFAEHHSDAERGTDFYLAKSIGGDGFGENIDADGGYYFGAGAQKIASYGLDPRGFRLFGGVKAEAAAGENAYGRGMADVTVTRPLFKGVDGAITAGAGYSAGTLPLQRQWFLGGSQSVRGQAAGAAFGDAFWMGRLELGTSAVGARPVVFYDIGWAGERDRFTDPGRPISGFGVGASFLDGLARFDIARGIYPEKKIRANLYLEARF